MLEIPIKLTINYLLFKEKANKISIVCDDQTAPLDSRLGLFCLHMYAFLGKLVPAGTQSVEHNTKFWRKCV